MVWISLFQPIIRRVAPLVPKPDCPGLSVDDHVTPKHAVNTHADLARDRFDVAEPMRVCSNVLRQVSECVDVCACVHVCLLARLHTKPYPSLVNHSTHPTDSTGTPGAHFEGRTRFFAQWLSQTLSRFVCVCVLAERGTGHMTTSGRHGGVHTKGLST